MARVSDGAAQTLLHPGEVVLPDVAISRDGSIAASLDEDTLHLYRLDGTFSGERSPFRSLPAAQVARRHLIGEIVRPRITFSADGSR